MSLFAQAHYFKCSWNIPEVTFSLILFFDHFCLYLYRTSLAIHSYSFKRLFAYIALSHWPKFIWFISTNQTDSVNQWIPQIIESICLQIGELSVASWHPDSMAYTWRIHHICITMSVMVCWIIVIGSEEHFLL